MSYLGTIGEVGLLFEAYFLVPLKYKRTICLTRVNV